MAAMVSAERRPSVNAFEAGSARQPRQKNFQANKHDHRREVETHSAETNRRQKGANGPQYGLSNAEENPSERLDWPRTRRGEPTQDNATEKAQQKDLRDVVNQDPHGGESEFFVDGTEQKCSFFLGHIDPDRKDEIHRGTLKTLHRAADSVAKATGEIDESASQVAIAIGEVHGYGFAGLEVVGNVLGLVETRRRHQKRAN